MMVYSPKVSSERPQNAIGTGERNVRNDPKVTSHSELQVREGDGMAMEVQFFAFYFVILLFFAIFAAISLLKL